MLAIEKVLMVQCRALWQHLKRYYREDKLDELIPIFPVWNTFFIFQERLQHFLSAASASGIIQSIISHSTSTIAYDNFFNNFFFIHEKPL